MSKHPSPKETEWADGAIFTVGHSTLPIERFVALLHAYGIECLADIRTVPRSRHNPQFNGDALSHALKPENIDYGPLPALGGFVRFGSKADILIAMKLLQRECPLGSKAGSRPMGRFC